MVHESAAHGGLGLQGVHLGIEAPFGGVPEEECRSDSLLGPNQATLGICGGVACDLGVSDAVAM